MTQHKSIGFRTLRFIILNTIIPKSRCHELKKCLVWPKLFWRKSRFSIPSFGLNLIRHESVTLYSCKNKEATGKRNKGDLTDKHRKGNEQKSSPPYLFDCQFWGTFFLETKDIIIRLALIRYVYHLILAWLQSWSFIPK